MFNDHRFERLLSLLMNKKITLEQYAESYSYLIGVKTTIIR